MSRRPWRGVAYDVRDAARREKLLASGLELFGTQGYAATTVRELCAHAGVATRTFYEHFPQREDLLLAVAERTLRDVGGSVLCALEAQHASSVERSYAVLGRFVHGLLDDPRRARVYAVEVVGVSPRVEARRRGWTRQFAALLEHESRQYVAAGTFPERDLSLTTVLLVGGLQELLVDWTDGDRARPLDELVDEAVRVFEAALAH